jgi:hypothetical protein
MFYFIDLCPDTAEVFFFFALRNFKSKTKVDLHDYDIQCIEQEILWIYEDIRFDYSDYDCLLSLRKDMINKRVLAHQEEILPDIIDFNEAMTEALRDMYDRAHRIWDSIKDNENFGEESEVTAKCFLSYDYPRLHPIQGEDRQKLWYALCDDEWNCLYADGVTLPTLKLSGFNDSFDSLIGMDCPPSNWNEGLDQKLTRDLHLTSAFHHLFDHTKFAITDFIYVREFETEINIEIDKTIKI